MKREVKVGLFAVAVLLVGWGVVRFLKGAEVFSSSNTYYAYYTHRIARDDCRCVGGCSVERYAQ